MPSTMEQSTPSSAPLASAEKHREETRRQIYWPFIAILAIFVIVMVLVFTVILPRRVQVSVVADFMTIIFVLCPAVICVFPFYLLSIAMTYGIVKLHDNTASPLARVEKWTEILLQKTGTATDTLNQRSIDVSARFAYLNRIISIFDRPSSDTKEEDGK